MPDFLPEQESVGRVGRDCSHINFVVIEEFYLEDKRSLATTGGYLVEEGGILNDTFQ